jgi:hypothetical protein
MSNYPYTFDREVLEFDKNRRRVSECPCGKSNKDCKFVPYVDCDIYGYCHSCGETFLPPLEHDKSMVTRSKLPRLKPKTSFIDHDVFERSITYQNHFISFLNGRFGIEITKQIVTKYSIGDSSYWQGATVFPQIDIDGKIRTGKIMLYNPKTGNRVKDSLRNYIFWIHKVLKIEDFSLNQCFFAEHLLRGNDKPVMIVESEKTAIIASLYLPQYVWIACGGKDGLAVGKCQVLKGRTVTFYPDVNSLDHWRKEQAKLSALIPEINFAPVSALLENNPPEEARKGSWDIADYLLPLQLPTEENPKLDPLPEVQKVVPSIEPQTITNEALDEGFVMNVNDKPRLKECWLDELSELESYFGSVELPTGALKLDKATSITNVARFINSNISVARFNNGKKGFLPYLDRVRQVRALIGSASRPQARENGT